MTLTIAELHDQFSQRRSSAEASYLGQTITVEAFALSTGTSEYGTPIVMASDTPGGQALAVFVLPFDDRIHESFARLDAIQAGHHLRVRGECRMVSPHDSILVFKDSVVSTIP